MVTLYRILSFFSKVSVILAPSIAPGGTQTEEVRESQIWEVDPSIRGRLHSRVL